MEYSQLGQSTLKVSRIGFGAMSLGKIDNGAAGKLISGAQDKGINFFDTSDLYDKGDNEKLLGRYLSKRRKEMVIATKVGNQWKKEGSGWDWNPTKEYILHAVDQSLARLGTDYIDLYQLHGGTINDPIDETIEAFERLVENGKILYYGISSIRPNVIRTWVQKSRIVSVMMQYSLLDRRPEETILPLLHSKSISLLARGPVAQGLLVNKEATPYLNYTREQVAAAAGAVQSMSGTSRSPAQTSIQYALSAEGVTAAVVGVRTMQQLDEAAETLKAPRLTQKEISRLTQALPANHYTEHK